MNRKDIIILITSVIMLGLLCIGVAKYIQHEDNQEISLYEYIKLQRDNGYNPPVNDTVREDNGYNPPVNDTVRECMADGKITKHELRKIYRVINDDMTQKEIIWMKNVKESLRAY